MPSLPRQPEDMLGVIEQQVADTDALRRRWDDDYSRFRLEDYQPSEEHAEFAVYTSNAPRTVAEKVMSWISSAELLLRIPSADQVRQGREMHDMKEQFLMGVLRAVDERLADSRMPILRDQLAFQAVVRGWVAGRSLLIKNEDGTTDVDITPWDLQDAAWYPHVGAPLQWAARRISRSRDEAEELYGTQLGADDMLDQDRPTVDVWEVYDREDMLTLGPGGQVLRKRTPHFAGRVPVVIVPVGPLPYVRHNDDLAETVADYGESIYASTRHLDDINNEVMSILLELVERSRKPPMKVRSRDGQKTLDDNPYVAGSTVSLGEGEDFAPADLMGMANETGSFLGLLSGEYQRGSIPHTLWGQLEFSLSGFAINSLRAGAEAVVLGRLRACEQFYKQSLNLISDMYGTGLFQAMRLRGFGTNNEFFDSEFQPMAISMAGVPEMTLIPALPEDDVQKFANAQIARDGPVPLMSDRWIRENTLGIQSADDLDAQIKEQMAERAVPEAQLNEFFQAAVRMGRQDLAQIYYMMLLQMQMAKAAMFGQPGAPGEGGPEGPPGGPGGGAPQQNGAGPPTFAPEVLPNAMAGRPPPEPFQQAGPVVPPGTPRPGAQSDAQRLAGLGLIAPGG